MAELLVGKKGIAVIGQQIRDAWFCLWINQGWSDIGGQIKDGHVIYGCSGEC